MKSTTTCVLVVMLVGSIMGKLSPPERSYKILMLLPDYIVMLINQPKSSKHPNIEDIPHDLPYFREDNINVFDKRNKSSGIFQVFETALPTLARELYEVPVVKDLYKRRKEFDVIVINQLFNEVGTLD
nr:uncharacterized protein LOC128703119 [Cherax quadricarinatus]